MTSPTPAPAVTEYVIRVPKNQKKKYQVMRFNSSLNIDFQKWTQVKMERENNMREFKGPDEEQPKYGAGSEFGRDAREEARRKKFGIVSRKYKPDDQPWLMKVKQAGKNSSYKGVREGGIAENAAYYVFTHAPDGAIDAYPLQEWYNFQPIHRYKALSAEEAEEEFGRRNKLMNYFSLMTRKRCRGKDDDAELDDPDEAKMKKGGIKKKELKISDMDDWVNSSDDDDTESETEGKDKEEAKEEKDKKKKQKEKDKNITKKKKKKDYDSEAFEESDDGDEEGREVDYISDSSDSESDHEGKANKQLKSVAEEDALRKLLSSGSSDDEDNEHKEKEKEESDKEEAEKEKAAKEGGDKPTPGKEESGAGAGAKKTKKKKKKKKTDLKAAKKEEVAKRASSSDFSSDSATDSEAEAKRKSKKESGGKGSYKDSKEPKDIKDLKERDGKDSASGGSSRSGTPTKEVGDNKRKMNSTPEPSLSKKMRLDNFASAPYSSSPTINSESGITEDAVRRYLMRKPMTTTELLQKFKSKKTGLNSDQLVNIMTQILKRINPVKQTIKGKMYLSIKH